MNTWIRDQIDHERQTFGDTPLYAEFSQVPATLGTPAYVTIPEFDTSLQFGPCAWLPRDPTTFPSIGDPCVVIQDNRRSWWIVGWWPANEGVVAPVVSGSKGGNAALASLISALAGLGLIQDTTT